METQTLSLDQIIAATRVAVNKRNTARDALASRLRSIIENTMSACDLTTVEVGGYKVEWDSVEQRCSQWADNSRAVTRRERHLLIGPERPLARSFGPLDLSFFDGHNQQHGIGRPQTDLDAVVRPATVAMLCAIAAALPARVAELLSARQEAMALQAEAAKAALAELPSA